MKNEINPLQAENRTHYPFFQSPRCGAKTKKRHPCQSPAVSDKKRCRMHGGAKGSGAPAGNKNAVKHGFTTAQAKQLKISMKLLLGELMS